MKCVHNREENACEHCRDRDVSELNAAQFRDAFQRAVRQPPPLPKPAPKPALPEPRGRVITLTEASGVDLDEVARMTGLARLERREGIRAWKEPDEGLRARVLKKLSEDRPGEGFQDWKFMLHDEMPDPRFYEPAKTDPDVFRREFMGMPLSTDDTERNARKALGLDEPGLTKEEAQRRDLAFGKKMSVSEEISKAVRGFEKAIKDADFRHSERQLKYPKKGF